jgi:hypothetical protein
MYLHAEVSYFPKESDLAHPEPIDILTYTYTEHI